MECNATNKTKNCNENFFISVEIILIMTLSLLSSYSFEVAHVCSADRSSNNAQVVNLGYLISGLVVLKEKLQILHILELHEFQTDR